MGTTAKMTIRHTPKTYNLGDGSSNPEQWKVILGGIKHVGSFRSKEAAERLRDSYNEYDTLKAKAELFDELVGACDLVSKRFSRVCVAGGGVKEFHEKGSFSEIMQLLSKAKELK